MTSSKLKASAILAVYNGEGTIAKCLDSLLTQSIPIEIIVVDDGSTDQTVSIIQKYESVTLFTQSHAGPAMARNLGAKMAKTDILLFVDADMTFDDKYVEQLIVPIQKNGVVGTYTVEEQVANWDNVWARCWNMQEGWANGKRFPANPPEYGTDYRAIRKSDFERVGGFDNIGYTDTWSLFNKLKVRPLRTHAVCYHNNPDNLLAVFRQARWAAKRPYKLGIFGSFYALLRTSIPISIIAGLVTAFKRQELTFIIFKITYDLGRLIGIAEMILTGKLAK